MKRERESNDEGSRWERKRAYTYTDESGAPLYRMVRLERGAGDERQKTFYAQRYDDENWVNGVEGVRLVLYQLPKVIDADLVFVVEGEQCCQTLLAMGIVATTNPFGAGNWSDEFGPYLAGKRIVILPDNDHSGRRHVAQVAASLLGVAAWVRIVELPGLQAKGDITDWRNAGGTKKQLIELARQVPRLDKTSLADLREKWGLQEVNVVDDWPQPLPLQNELPPVELFSENLLPESLRPLVLDVAERMQVPPDLPATAVILCIAGSVSRRATIQPKANDTAWIVVPNLWGGIIAPPGYMKSPVLHAACGPANMIQADWRDQYDQAVAQFEQDKEEWGLRYSAWKEEYKARTRTRQTLPQRPSAAPRKPMLRRLIVNDSTFEALHLTMSENPAGILLIRDELTGWLATLDKPGREGERAFALEAWNGNSSYTVDRIGRGTIHVPHCCMSMLGGIQPGRLRSYLADALEDGPANDGLIQRFQLLVWPDTDANYTYVDRPPDPEAELQVANIIRELLKLGAERPVLFHFSTKAQELVERWFAELEGRIRGNELHPALISHLSKYRSLMPSLALLFELADLVSSEGFDGASLVHSENLVRLKHTQQAIAFCRYSETHAKRVYSCVVNPQLRAARELAERIKNRKVDTDGFFNCRDIYLKGWSGLDTPERARAALEVLEDAGWVRREYIEPGPLGGRPSDRYAVNPKVLK